MECSDVPVSLFGMRPEHQLLTNLLVSPLISAFNDEIYKQKESDLSCITFKPNDPFQLFREWYDEAQESDLVSPNALCFATSSKEGRVSSRHLLLRRLDDDGFVIMTDRRSKKSKELVDNPVGAMSFLWSYKKEGLCISRQVRIEGRVVELPREDHLKLYEREPLFCKLRAHICWQGKVVDWKQLKHDHDHLYSQVKFDGKALPMPDHFVAYKLVPDMMEFYYSHDNTIADRLMFLAVDETATRWEKEHLSA